MKIKKFDNIWLMGIILASALILGIYILKIFFPNLVIETAQVDSITRIGHYIDTHKWAWYIASFFLSFFVCYFTFCACCRKKALTIKETVITIVAIILLYIVKEFLPNQYTSLNISIMVFLPMLFKGDFKATAICFISTNFLQTITGEIRNIMAMISDFNFATLLIVMIDYYIFIFLLYCLFNYKKEVN